MIDWSACKTSGVWWVGFGPWRLMVKAPWSRPLFSELYGLKPTLRLPFGWRIQSFVVH